MASPIRSFLFLVGVVEGNRLLVVGVAGEVFGEFYPTKAFMYKYAWVSKSEKQEKRRHQNVVAQIYEISSGRHQLFCPCHANLYVWTARKSKGKSYQ